jgi:hypothetical protein
MPLAEDGQRAEIILNILGVVNRLRSPAAPGGNSRVTTLLTAGNS